MDMVLLFFIYYYYFTVQDIAQYQYIQAFLLHSFWSSCWRMEKENQMFSSEMIRNKKNFPALYKEPFLSSADGFDGIVRTVGCL